MFLTTHETRKGKLTKWSITYSFHAAMCQSWWQQWQLQACRWIRSTLAQQLALWTTHKCCWWWIYTYRVGQKSKPQAVCIYDVNNTSSARKNTGILYVDLLMNVSMWVMPSFALVFNVKYRTVLSIAYSDESVIYYNRPIWRHTLHHTQNI